MNLRPWLRNTLIATAMISVALLAWQAEPASTGTLVSSPVARLPAPALASSLPLPESLAHSALEQATANPFTGNTPQGVSSSLAPPPGLPLPPGLLPPLQTAGPTLVLPPPIPAPVVAPAPTVNYRYAGRFRDPSGKLTVYLGTGTSEVAVIPGAELEGGWKAVELTTNFVRLLHLPTDTSTTISIPDSKD